MPWIAAAAAVGGSLMDKHSQSQANKSNTSLNAANRKWQERMSNTAHRREANDLSKAGLNRILSVKQSGASTPSGNVPDIKPELSNMASTAKDTVLQIQQLKNLKAQEAKTKAETVNTVNASKKSGVEASLWETIAGVPQQAIKHGQTAATSILDNIFGDINLNSAPKSWRGKQTPNVINSNHDMFKSKNKTPNPDMPNKHRKRKSKKRIRR